MKKFFSGRGMLYILILLAITLTAPKAEGQVTVTLGTGTAAISTNAFVATTTTSNRYSYNFTIYDAAEILSNGGYAGLVEKLAWYKDGTGEYTSNDGVLKIYLKHVNFTQHTTSLETWSEVITGATLVYSSNTVSWPTGTGWKELNLQSPFIWNGTDNLAVLVDWYRPSDMTTSINWRYTTVTSANKWRIGSAPISDMNQVNSNRANLQVTIAANSPCAAPPTAGTATANPATEVCQLSPVSLSITGNTTGSGQTYKWQSSPTLNGTYTDITTESVSPITVVNPAATTYYQAVVTCSGQSSTTSPVLVQVNPGLAAGTYTINSAAATGGSNFQSFGAAVSAMACGIQGPVVFNVDPASGPYNEQVVIPQIINANAVNTITFNGNGRTIQAAPVSATRAIIKLDGADYIYINNLRLVSQDATYGWGVHITNIAENNSINNCTIDLSAITSTTQSNSGGIIASGSATSVTTTGNTGHNNSITGNTIIGAYQGIIMYGNSANPSMNNVISNNIIRDFYANGIELNYHNGTTLSGNDISRAARVTVTTFAGIEIGVGCNSLNINANRIHDTHNSATSQSGTAYGIYFNASDADGGTENIVSNNLIYNFNSLTGTQYGLYNSSSNNVWYYYNTVILDNAASTAGTTRAFFQTTLATGIELKNNLLYVTRGGTGTKHVMYYGTNTSLFASDNNLLYINSPAGTNNAVYLNPDTYATLGDWQNLNAYDLSSTDVAPSFVSPATGDFTPVTASIDNLGVPVSVNTDILNATRDATTPDIGAYEFAVSGCSAPPTAGTASVTPSGTLCAGTLVDFVLTGNSIGTGQTYQWQSSATTGSGFTNISAALADPAFSFNVTTSQYYRVAVTCSGNTQYSNEIYIAVPALFPAGTYTINSTLSTGGNNFQTIGEAVSAIQCGVTGGVTFNVDAASGPYNEQVIIPQITGADAANRIVFNGNGRTISFLSTNTNERAGIKLNGADFITIDNFVITATGTTTTEYGFGIQVLGDADNNIISNNTVNINTSSSSTNYSGIAIGGTATSATATGSNTDNTIVSGNTITGGNYGISLYGVSGALIQNNQVINNIIRDQDEEGIYVTYTNNTLVENNDISRPTRVAPDAFTGIYFSSQSLNARVSKNRIHDPFAADLADVSTANGIYFTSCDATAGNENIVSNNAIYNFNGGGIQYGIYNNGSDSVWFYHNTVNLDDASYAGTSVTRGFYQLTTARGVEFRNNIVRVRRGGTGIKHVLYHGATTTASTIISDNNDLYMASSAGTNYIAYLAVPTPATSFASLAEWRTESGQDLASDSLDPFFVNAAAGNLAPREILLDNKGVALGITTDILNASRSATTPDVGAWEFTGSVTLPVKLLNIFASKLKNDVLVNWTTASEINSSRFEIERSLNGTDFYFAGSLSSANNVNGSSYSFKDIGAIHLATGMVMYYRIKMIDIDGTYEYSSVATVKVDKELKFTAEAFPNPFREMATIKFTAINPQTFTIKVIDINGKLLIKEKITIPAGVTLVPLSQSSQLTAGVYMAVIEFGGQKQTLQLIRQ